MEVCYFLVWSFDFDLSGGFFYLSGASVLLHLQLLSGAMIFTCLELCFFTCLELRY